MSIQKIPNRGGQYLVRWREGGKQQSRLFKRKGDAQEFESEVKRRRRLGPLASTVMVSQMTLADFMVEEWWPRCAIPNLAPDTRRRYLEVWSHDLLPRLGGYPLADRDLRLVEADSSVQGSRGAVNWSRENPCKGP